MQDEILDLVDNNDNIIGKIGRAEAYSEGIRNYRVVNVFLVNKKGEIWIPQRTSSKEMFPSAFDLSAGGHVKEGETYEQALSRELAEELSIDAKKVSIKEVGYLNPYIEKVSSFMKIYEILSDAEPDFNREDFSEGRWLSARKLLELTDKEGVSAKPDLPFLVKKYYISR